MTIRITQQCERCQKSRVLDIPTERPLPISIETFAKETGWREIDDDRHLCRKCIKEVLKE